MTPEHQTIIDITLNLAHVRAAGLVEQTDFPRGFRPGEQTVERLRASLLGRRLTAIADYAEGYAYQGEHGDIRVELQQVIMILFADMIQQNSFRYPLKFHQTPLGSLFSQAALRFFRQERPAGRLIKVAEARQICGVSRQIIHEWAADGLLWPMYDEHGTLWLDRAEVERWQQKRALSHG